jgi:hypothetical protein
MIVGLYWVMIVVMYLLAWPSDCRRNWLARLFTAVGCRLVLVVAPVDKGADSRLKISIGENARLPHCDPQNSSEMLTSLVIERFLTPTATLFLLRHTSIVPRTASIQYRCSERA